MKRRRLTLDQAQHQLAGTSRCTAFFPMLAAQELQSNDSSAELQS